MLVGLLNLDWSLILEVKGYVFSFKKRVIRIEVAYPDDLEDAVHPHVVHGSVVLPNSLQWD